MHSVGSHRFRGDGRRGMSGKHQHAHQTQARNLLPTLIPIYQPFQSSWGHEMDAPDEAMHFTSPALAGLEEDKSVSNAFVFNIPPELEHPRAVRHREHGWDSTGVHRRREPRPPGIMKRVAVAGGGRTTGTAGSGTPVGHHEHPPYLEQHPNDGRLHQAPTTPEFGRPDSGGDSKFGRHQY